MRASRRLIGGVFLEMIGPIESRQKAEPVLDMLAHGPVGGVGVAVLDRGKDNAMVGGRRRARNSGVAFRAQSAALAPSSTDRVR